jgi:hypothetical protein
MDFEQPWWLGLLPVVFVAFGGYRLYEQQRFLFTFQDAQLMAAELQVYGAQSSDRFARLDDKTADSIGILSGFTGALDRPKLTFAPADLNGSQGAAYTITAHGLNKGDCLNLEPNVLFDSVTVNGQKIERQSMSAAQIEGLCHSTFWPWTNGNVVTLTGS